MGSRLLRVRPQFSPRWEGPVFGFAKKFCLSHQWRTRPEYTCDDLMQEAWLLFNTIKDKYPEINRAKHFMGMFKVCLNNRVNQLANRRTKQHTKGDIPISTLTTDDSDNSDLSILAGITSGCLDQIEIDLLIADAPPVVAALLRNFNDESVRPRYVRRGERKRIRQTTNELMCSVLGQNPDHVDMFEQVTNWLRGEPTDEILSQ